MIDVSHNFELGYAAENGHICSYGTIKQVVAKMKATSSCTVMPNDFSQLLLLLGKSCVSDALRDEIKGVFHTLLRSALFYTPHELGSWSAFCINSRIF